MASGYCERLDPSFWAEPLNAVSNGAFLLAALAAGAGLRVRWRAGAKDWPELALTVLTASIAYGSFLFHTRPGPVTVLADVVPIQLFVAGYFFLALRRFLELGMAAALLGVAGLVGVSAAVGALFGNALNGGAGYLPALGALFVIGLWLLIRARAAIRELARRQFRAPEVARAGLRAAWTGRALIGVGALFLVSLFFRTIDRAVCPSFPAGTHWLWHLLNAAVLFALLRTAIRHQDAARS